VSCEGLPRPVRGRHALTRATAACYGPPMRFEVEVVQEDGGLFKASAVAYPGVSATGRTEKEALSLLVEARERHLKAETHRASS
jgi:predicted RNase H-like HicB family nuclease